MVSEGNIGIAPVGGLGDSSYALNSSNQGNAMRSLFPTLEKAVMDHMLCPPDRGILRVADLGCSSGMNTINNMQFLIHTLRHKFKHQLGCSNSNSVGDQPLEFQVFFSDLPSNDFNTLFSLLANTDNSDESRVGGRDYFIAGVPGSFYTRLFPKASLHVAFSSVALHWISKVPDEVVNRDTAAWNGGHVWIHDGNPRVAEAYAKLAKDDLQNFLRARREELLPGGLLFVVFQGRSTSDPNKQYHHEDVELMSSVFPNTWNELVAEGVIKPETRDSFNMPMYFRSKEEVLEVVQEISDFKVEQLEVQDIAILGAQKHAIGSIEEYGRELANYYRSLWGGYVDTHLQGLAEAKIFHERIEENAIAYVEAKPERRVSYRGFILLVLQKKHLTAD